MTDRRSGALLGLAAALALGAAVALVATSGQGAAARRDAREFQSLVHGLGFGPATDLERCGSEFDPRVSGGGARGIPGTDGLTDAGGPCGTCPRSPLSPAFP